MTLDITFLFPAAAGYCAGKAFQWSFFSFKHNRVAKKHKSDLARMSYSRMWTRIVIGSVFVALWMLNFDLTLRWM